MDKLSKNARDSEKEKLLVKKVRNSDTLVSGGKNCAV